MTENITNRKIRTTVTRKDILQIKNMKLNNKKAKEIACDVMLSVSTVYNILRKLEEKSGDIDSIVSSFKKPGRRSVDNAEFIQTVGEAIQSDPCYTQNGIKENLFEQGVTISQSSVSLTLKKLGFSRKRVAKIADRTLSPEVISERKRYALRLRTISKNKLLFLDETGFNLHSSRNYGYSPINVPCVSIVPANKGRNVSFLSIISENMILNTKSIIGSFNSAMFLDFLEDCKIKSIIRKDNYIILDNCRIHKTREIMEFFRINEFNVLFLPPYTPQLNHIEQVFGILKNRYYGLRPRARTATELISSVNSVIDGMNDEASHMLRNLYSHMRENLDIAFNGGLLN